MEKEKNKKDSQKEYRAKSIEVLKGLEPVRRRPGMFIGTTEEPGIFHLIRECVDNACDEALAGYAKNIKVSFLKEDKVMVEDDGRGIPVDIHPVTKKSALETVMCTLHAGGKFSSKVYQISGGLHGVGVSVVNALSDWMRVEVKRDGYLWSQEYKRGKPVTKVRKEKKVSGTGTKVIFHPDPEIFEKIELNPKKVISHLREQAFLTPKVKFVFCDQRKEIPSCLGFYNDAGILSFLKTLTFEREIIQEEIFYVNEKYQEVFVEVTFCYTDDLQSKELSFANNIKTTEGGTHLTGFRAALTRALNEYAKKNNLFKNSEGPFLGDDVREGLYAIISVKLKEPQFEGQVKAKLGNPEAKTATEAVVFNAFQKFLEENPSDAKKIFEKCFVSYKARKAARAAKESVIKKSLIEGLSLPGKLADCSSRKPEERELFIVEGESAGGSAKQARDRRFQAILPLRGKILNVERVHLDKILASKEIKSLVIALGTAIAESFDLNKLRYHRIIIMTDADSITGDTPIFLFNKEKQEFFLTEVKDFIENCDDTTKYQVLTFNLRTKKRELKEIYQTIKHPLRTSLFKIKTYCGYSIKVTSCHSVYVYENGKVVTKKGNEIKPGDLLIFPKSFPSQNKRYKIDLKDVILNSNFKNISVKVSKKKIKQIPNSAWCELDFSSWRKLQKQRELVGVSRKTLGQSIGIYDKVIQQWEQKIDNVMPRFYQFKNYLTQIGIKENISDYNVYIPIDKWQKNEFSKEIENVEFYLGNHTRKIKTEFELDQDLGFLIGFFLGDGCASAEKNSPNRFSISLNKEKSSQYIEKLSQIIREKFNAKPILEYRNTNILLHFHSFEFKLLLTKLGLLGKKSYEKFIPDIFFNVKKEVQESLIQGLLCSDGFITVWQSKKDKRRKAIYGWQVSSKKLALGILTIFRQWGIFPAYTVSQNKDHLRKDGKIIRSNFKSYNVSISTVDYLIKTKNVWKDHKDAWKLKNYLKKVNYKKIRGKEIHPVSSDFVALKVKKVKEIKNPDDKFVYDFSVWKDQNFIAGPGGVLLHNTDGAHIRTLLLTLFYRYFQPIIEKGYLYIARPPLYRIQSGKKIEYAYSEEEKAKILEEILKLKKKDKSASITIQRYKGLGEMNPEELWETTMNPEKRILLKVTIEDAKEADRIFDILMGSEVEPRKRFIQTYAKEVKNLDI